MYDVAAVGECLIDFTPSGVDDLGMLRYSRNPGGAPANVLAMAAKLGASTAFLGKVGDDEFGYFLKSELERSKINTEGLLLTREFQTSLAFVHLSDDGERTFTFYRKNGADVFFSVEDIKTKIVEDSKIFHFGSVSLSSEPSRSATLSAVKRAKNKGAIISFDPNYRHLLWESEENALTEIKNALPLADIVKVSSEELLFITGTSETLLGAKILTSFGPSLVLVTLGEEGAFFYNGSGSGFVPAFSVKAIDATGAGDAFLGSMLFNLIGMKKEDLNCIAERELRSHVTFSNAAAGISVTIKGAITSLPALSQIESLLKIHKR